MYNSAFDGRPAPGPVWPHCRESDEINCTKHSDAFFFEVFAFKQIVCSKDIKLFIFTEEIFFFLKKIQVKINLMVTGIDFSR